MDLDSFDLWGGWSVSVPPSMEFGREQNGGVSWWDATHSIFVDIIEIDGLPGKPVVGADEMIATHAEGTLHRVGDVAIRITEETSTTDTADGQPVEWTRVYAGAPNTTLIMSIGNTGSRESELHEAIWRSLRHTPSDHPGSKAQGVQEISDLRDSEIKWVAENLANARELVEAIGRAPSDGRTIDPAALDAAWSAFLARWRPGAEDANPTVNALGIAFGQYLVERLGLTWKVVHDRDGTEIAIHGQPGDILIFPTNLVAKRLEPRTTNFFASVAAAIEQEVTKVRDTKPARGLGLARFLGRKDRPS